MLPATTERVRANTPGDINQRLRDETISRLDHYARHPDRIGARLDELDRERDVERTLETNASAFALAGVMLGATVDRRWLALPALVAGFLFQHATQGWCPPLPVLRRLGFRTQSEIQAERCALKALRGDFRDAGV